MTEGFWWLYKDTHLELVEETTQRNGQMGSERQQGGVHIGDCGATGVEFVAKQTCYKRRLRLLW